MPDITSKITNTNQLQKKIVKDLNTFLKNYSDLEKEISLRFNEEYKYNNYDVSGLEDFQRLRFLCKKNLNVIKTMNNLLSKVHDLSSYEIGEEEL